MAIRVQHLFEFATECDHGIVVIEGRATKANHSAWDPSRERQHLDADSLYVVAMPSVEGTVTVEVYSGDVSGLRDDFSDLEVLFSGRLTTDSHELVVGDSDGNEERSISISSQSLLVVVLGDDPQFAERVVIGIQEDGAPRVLSGGARGDRQ